LTSARPQAVAALLRYFRNLETAEEAFQEACLRALQKWPVNGPPRDPAAWLILVGRNFALDEARRRSKQTALPDEDLLSNTDDAEAALADRLDGEDYRDDVLRLWFVCCHPDLPATQQSALASWSARRRWSSELLAPSGASRKLMFLSIRPAPWSVRSACRPWRR
jgi:RNA polymerase sigma-70 factor (ECF subfamily)